MDEKRAIQIPGPEPAELPASNSNARHAVDEQNFERKPSPQELKRILARHRGWLVNPPKLTMVAAKPLPEHDRYLEEIEPAYTQWREEALKNPEQLRLSDANLRSAQLSRAELSGAELTGVDLSEAQLFNADLSGAELSSAQLNGADLELTRFGGRFVA
jgi:hypothetical protein